MADDVESHQIEFEIDEQMPLRQFIKLVDQHDMYRAYGGAIWAGHYDDYKCIRDNRQRWLTDPDQSVGNFFEDINNNLRLERQSRRCGQRNEE